MTPSDLIIPGYTVHGPIGQGGMASVYLATQESLNRKVAIKVLRNVERDSASAKLNARFINEAHFIASLNNPHIITIHDIATLANGDHYIAMEFVSGGDLDENLERFREPQAALGLIREIAQGLAVVHQQGIIHRDVKPANILFRKDKTVVLTDFGIAKEVDNNSDLTQAGFSLGSPSYSSPEQAQGQPLDITSDIYSLGVILLELLLGYNPFKGDSHTGTAINHIQQPVPELPTELAYLAPLLKRMLAKTPAKRFQSCEALVKAIQSVHQPSATTVATSAPARQSDFAKPAFLQSRPALALAGIASATLLIAALTYESETDKEINRLLEQAELGLEEERYIFPEQDNARYYFRQVLMLDDDNSAAEDGLAEVTARLVQRYVTQGTEALERGDLNRPKGNNALYFYREALALDAENSHALAGMGQVVDEYTRRARTDLLEGDIKGADRNVKRGLKVQPDDEELLALRKEVDEKMPRAKRLIRNVFGKIREQIDNS
ncbi:protein kinase [Microbulbifer agarilyticus]|uniref:serine/threonine-protein kinase n=1 Tax=Microbulbifer agarilyticus TaxID=260552 RepID=UPI001C95A8CD|nr:serine/threonine-protein kinase [Microbulbifer agarilyticus]MBY6190135.1 protein kinase [Microbulbifer agarilyticus]